MVEKPKSIDDLRRILSRLLGISEDKLPFEFYKRDGELVAHQNSYIPNYDDWFKIYNYAMRTGRVEQDEEDRSWYFVFPKSEEEFSEPKEEPSGLPLHLRVEETVTEETRPAEPPMESLEPGYYHEFPIDRILTNPFSFRVNIEEGLEELMMEIHAAGMIIEPLICRPAEKPGYAELCAGERRLRAARKMLMKKVPIIVRKMDDAEFDRVRFLENLARKDLTDMEVARALDYMLKHHRKEYPSQKVLADALGKTPAWVSYHLRMLDLEEFWTENISKLTRVNFSEIATRITEFQAREILSTPLEKRNELALWLADKLEKTGEVPSAREIRKFIRPVEAVPEAPEIPEVPLEEEEKPKPTITCDGCGKPVTTPVHIKGKFYCEECARKVLEKPAKPLLDDTIVLEALERLFPNYPRGVDFETIKRELSEYDTYNLSDILVRLGTRRAIYLHDGKWMSREEYEKMQKVLDDLRAKIREAEQVLIDNFDFDPKRGLETYKMAEIKFLAKKNGPTADFLSALRRCVDLQKEFYRVLHGQEEFKPLKTDAATQSIARIDSYLEKTKPATITGVTVRPRLPCPICRHPLPRKRWEQLKRKFSHYKELWKE